MTPANSRTPARSGFSLIEVTLAIGIVGVAILSLVGILGSTFQQVDEIMQTNRALAGASRLMGALDNPRSIVYVDTAEENLPNNTKYLLDAGLALENGNPAATNFDIAYRLLRGASSTGDNAVWLYVYERKIVSLENDRTGDTTYALSSNPSLMEVAYCAGNNLSVAAAAGRNIIGTPMRVRISLSKLLVGQRATINPANLEPQLTPIPPPPWTASPLPAQPSAYALAYLPVVVEFFPHDYSPYSEFKNRTDAPLLVQNIVISR
ncbi:MAG: type IV pilus modification PilV family protein [Opitutales bacterium]